MVNFHIISLLAPLFIAFVLAVQLAGKIRQDTGLPPKMLLWFIINVFIVSSTIVIYQSGYYNAFRFFDGIYMSSMLLLHPLFYFYIRSLITNKFKSRLYLLHFLPSIVTFVIATIFYLQLSKEGAISYLTGYILGEPSGSLTIQLLYRLFTSSKYIHAIQAIVYFILVFKLLSKHQKAVDQIFSAPDHYKLGWLVSFNIIYSVMSLAGAIANLIPTSITYSTTSIIDFTMLIFGIFTFFVGIKGLEQKPVGQIIHLNDKLTSGNETGSIPSNKLIEKINRYVIDKEAFLNPELKIWDIVEYTGINRSYISQAINTEFLVSFNHYINKLRIDKACMLLKTDTKKSIESIAFDSGFNSLSTFNRAFKKFTGLLPSQYRNRELC
jgi:AraC-like DNA-binding protein